MAADDRQERVLDASPDDLRSALQAIPESQRKALLLREWRGFSYDEIGSELGLSQSATEALLFRARQNVAQRLGAGLKTLNGLPVLTFIRSLFKTGTAKLVAAAVGTTLTVAAVPAAQPRQSDVGARLPHAVGHTVPALPQRNAAPSPVHRASRPAGVTHITSLPAAEHRAPIAPTAPAAPRSDVSTPAKPPPAPVQNDGSTPTAATTGVVNLATPDVGVDVPLPAVTTPSVAPPDLGVSVTAPSVAVDVPPLPKVELP